MIPASMLGLGLKQPEMAADAVLLDASLSLDFECCQLTSEKVAHRLSDDTKGMKTL